MAKAIQICFNSESGELFVLDNLGDIHIRREVHRMSGDTSTTNKDGIIKTIEWDLMDLPEALRR